MGQFILSDRQEEIQAFPLPPLLAVKELFDQLRRPSTLQLPWPPPDMFSQLQQDQLQRSSVFQQENAYI